MVVPGVSIKIEVASSLDRVTDCTIGPPFLGGEGRSNCVPPQKMLKSQSPKNAIFSILDVRTTDVHSCNIF